MTSRDIQSRSIATHAAGLVAARVTAAAMSAATVFLVVRVLPKSTYGDYGIIVGIVGMVVVLSDLGLTTALARYIAQGAVPRHVLVRVLLARACVALVAAAGFAGVGLAMARGMDIGPMGSNISPGMLYAAAGLCLAQSMFSIVSGLLPTLRRIGALMALTISQTALEFAAVVAVASLSLGASAIVVASTVAAAIGALVGVTVVVRSTPRLNATAAASVRTIATYSRPMFLVALCFAAFGLVDQLFIWVLHGSEAAAAYIANWKLITLLHLPGLAVATVIAPRLAGGGPERRAMYLRWLGVMALGYVGVIAVCATLATPIVTLALGEAYASNAGVFAALGVYALLLGIAPHVTMAANFLGGARKRVRLSVVTIALNVVLDLLLVPTYGAYGAAVATSIAFSWYVGAHVVLSYRLLGGELTASALRASLGGRIGRVTLDAAFIVAAVVAAVGTAYTVWTSLSQYTWPAVSLMAAVSLGFAAYLGVLWVAWQMRNRAPVANDVVIEHAAIWDGTATVRVLHVCDFAAPYPGAFIRQLRMLAGELRERSGGRATVAFAFPARAEGARWLDDLRADGFHAVLLPEPRQLPTREIRNALTSLVADLRPEVVHTHFGSYDMVVAATLRRLPRAMRPSQVWHYRTALEEPIGERSPGRRIKDVLKYRIYGRSVDRCIGVTEAVAVEAARRGLGGGRAQAIVAGCDTDVFCNDAESRSRVRGELGVADDEVLVLHMGWAWHRKGGDLLASAGRLLEQRGVRGLRLMSVGASDTDIEAPVTALAATDSIYELHQASDIFVSASRSEAFGNGLVEAFACERLGVAALAAGQQEIFDALPGCIAIPTDDAAAIADAIEVLLARRGEWATLGAGNREHIVEHYSMRRWARQMADLYDELRPSLVSGDDSSETEGREAA